MGLPLSKLFKGILLALSLAVLVACTATRTDSASERTYVFGLTPATLPTNEALGLCAAEALEEGANYRIESLFPSQMRPTELDVVLHLAPELDEFPNVVQIAVESIFLISHPANSAISLSEADLAAIFSGQTSNWSAIGGDDREISLWAPTASEESRAFLEERILNGLPLSSNARLASSPEQMLSAVRNDQQAIGVLPGAWLDNSLHSTVLGADLPLLLSAPNPFEGELQNLAACLQSGAGQDLLMEIYDG